MDTKNTAKQESVDLYPGAATDVADQETVNNSEVKQETRILNNNPRNEAIIDD